jgi:D-alanyl-lipoteichoic acid acyltransferase DltB (MBOAT superfamily)
MSYLFYGYWDWRFCGLLALSTVIDYLAGIKIYESSQESLKKRFLFLSLISNLGILGFFKYFNFFIDSFESVFSSLFNSRLDFLHLNVVLPVGISFYTFQTLSYTIDIYKNQIKPTRNFIDFALFVSFFPQLVAGPIERAKNLLPQLSKEYFPSRIQIKQGVVLIIFGLFRKVMIGDTAGRYVDHIFEKPDIYFSDELLFALILFSIQIYADFSGYSSIARGVAKLLGIELMENFNQPYFSRNITEFWRRWHISLSHWLRDYLYIPLGGNRKGKIRTYLHLMITMLLGGLWHGASWNFVIWGGLHGLYLSIHKLFLKGKKISLGNIKRISPRFIFSVLLTNVLVVFTWLFFRSQDFEETKLIIEKLWTWHNGEHTLLFSGIAFSYIFTTGILDYFEYKTRQHEFLLIIKSPGIKAGILITLFLVTLIYMIQSKPLPFIYFQF